MKIGIVGNYGNNNQGDEAILHGILIQLENTFQVERKDITVFSTNPVQTAADYGVQTANLTHKRKSSVMTFLHTLLKNKSSVGKLDLLIIGGGGILMDLYRNSTILFGLYGWLAKVTSTPFIIYGAGAGPITTLFGERVVRHLGNNAKLVSVRDNESQRLLRHVGVNKEVHVIGDPAFQVTRPSNQSSTEKALQIGVTAVPYYHSSYWPEENRQFYSDYINGMAQNLDKLLEQNPDAAVNFFATKHPHDTEVTKDITHLMTYNRRCRIYDENLTHMDIVTLLMEQDLLIGTRLHSLILALVANTPIIAVSYHQKVKDFMVTIDCQDFSVDINALHLRDDYFVVAFAEMNEDWANTLNKSVNVYEQMKQKSDQGMELVKEVVGDRR